MFLVFTLVLLVVAVGILASVYSIFFPFMQNLWTVNQYHMAYYGAFSAVERAELWLRYRSPWFQWSWWFFWTWSFGPLSDNSPELFPGAQQWFRRTIYSRTNSIPNLGKWNTDPMLSDISSKDYNQLWYTYLETLLLQYDNITDVNAYYTWTTSLSYFSGDIIQWIFRLPPKIFNEFWWSTSASLCDSYADDCDPDGDGIYDDVALSRSMEWLYNGNGFKIFPTMAIFYYSGMQVDEFMDNAIRESIINATGVINFTTSFTPVIHGNNIIKHNVVGANPVAIEWQTFKQIFNNSTDFSSLRLSFGAANLFRTFTGTIYPYLEYQFTFPQQIADRFYTIQGNGRVGEYDVKILLKKPTVQDTIGWDFTVIF